MMKALTVALLLGAVDGYEWRRVIICPARHLGWPMRRQRAFWLGRLRGGSGAAASG